MTVLDQDAISSVDTSGQLDEVLGLSEHLRDALWRVDSARATPVDATGGLIVAGMGGSAAGARLAIGALGRRLTRPFVVADGYELPGWAGPCTLVLCSSYSGCTEETLAAYDHAAALEAPRIVVSTGGPRAAIGYSLVAALEAAALAGAAPSVRDEIEAAADLAETLAAEWGPDGGDEAKDLARALQRTVPVIAGAELAAAAAYRWKSQFNENAAVPECASVLPEADHNEVVGWAAARELGRFAYISLEDGDAHPRNAMRAGLTAELAAAGADPVLRVRARGSSPVERLVSLVLLGDLVAIYLAVLRGADPAAIPAIDSLKAALSER
jgi:glucose/mannose-6-phosphate isomerase